MLRQDFRVFGKLVGSGQADEGDYSHAGGLCRDITHQINHARIDDEDFRVAVVDNMDELIKHELLVQWSKDRALRHDCKHDFKMLCAISEQRTHTLITRLCRACAKALARAAIARKLVSCGPSGDQVVTFVVACALRPYSRIRDTDRGRSCIVESIILILASAIVQP